MGGTNEDWEALRKPTVYGLREHGFKEYGVSKLAQILFSVALSERAANWLNGTRLIARAIHPGGVGTGIYSPVPWPFRLWVTSKMLSWEEGSRTVVWAALADAEARYCPWLYFDNCKCRKPSPSARNVELRQKMWNYSIRALSD